MQCSESKPAKYEPIVYAPRWLAHKGACGDCDIKRTTPCKDCNKK
jgi:hypothetical protein